MIKLGTKLSGPYGAGVRFALINATAILFVFLAMMYISNSGFGGFFGCLFLVLTFPANLIHYSNSTPTGGGWGISFFFLNPLVWGLIAFVVHKATKSQNAASNSKNAKFMGPPCVACRAPTDPDSGVCPECGWTQPQ